MASAKDVALWMLEKLKRERTLYQETAVGEIAHIFGEKFVYDNRQGNPAIDKDVLTEFRKLTEDTVVWERGERAWRFRDDTDPLSRRVD